jgi:hypothetical protein
MAVPQENRRQFLENIKNREDQRVRQVKVMTYVYQKMITKFGR